MRRLRFIRGSLRYLGRIDSLSLSLFLALTLSLSLSLSLSPSFFLTILSSYKYRHANIFSSSMLLSIVFLFILSYSLSSNIDTSFRVHLAFAASRQENKIIERDYRKQPLENIDSLNHLNVSIRASPRAVLLKNAGINRYIASQYYR